MQEAEKSNVVQISDFAHRRGHGAPLERPTATLSIAQPSDAPVPRVQVPYPGGIDDLPI
jgi:hypothetical protein